jgi:hypothetical protein
MEPTEDVLERSSERWRDELAGVPKTQPSTTQPKTDGGSDDRNKQLEVRIAHSSVHSCKSH